MNALSDLRALVSSLPMPVILLGPDERVSAVNDLAAELLGHDGLGRHYVTALRQPDVLDAVERTFGDHARRSTRYLGTESGRDTTWQVSASPVRLSGGTGVVLAFEDITAMEQAGQMRRDFVANVSHELRTPLTALLGFVETLKGPARNDADARDRFLGIMEREAGRMARLVEDLLSLSRVEEDERVRPMAMVDLSEMVSEVAEVFRPLAAQNGLELRVTMPEQAIHVPGEAGQLRQVLNNLLENGIKYGGAGETVELTLSAPRPESSLRADAIRLSVRDHGDGIAAHHIARLTERFYRVDTHRSREIGGTGLGLAIVKHIVNRHRGRLRIESNPGEGSLFTVILPLQ